jgi:hypothetical protein
VVALLVLVSLAAGLLWISQDICRAASDDPPGPVSIAFGETVSASLEFAGDTDTYTFSAQAGDQILCRMRSSWPFSPQLRLYAQDGMLITSVLGTYGCELNETLSTTENYTLLAGDAEGDDTGDYWVFLQRTNNPSEVTPLAFGQTIAANITQLAEMDAYTFSAKAGDQIVCRMRSSWPFSPQLRLYAQDGTLIKSVLGTYGCELNETLSTTENYTLLAGDAEGDGTGDYWVFLQRTNNPSEVIPLAFGQTIAANITQLAEMDAYTFSAKAGDQIVCRMRSSWPFSPQLRLYAQDGTLITSVLGTYGCELNETLSTTENYTLLAGDAEGDDTGDYWVFLQRTNNPSEVTPLAFGQTIAANITQLAEMDAYTFSAKAGDQILCRMRSSWPFSPQLRLYAQDGALIKSVLGTYGCELNETLSTTENYTLLAGDAEGDDTGDYDIFLESTGGNLTNNAPDQPDNVLPANNAIGISLAPVLQSSAFFDPDSGDAHVASQWQITIAPGDYSSPVFDSGTDSSNLTQITIPSGTLSHGTTYYWRVRHEDNHGDWSAWSVETSFITLGLPLPPEESSFTGSVPLPSELSTDPGVIGTNIGLAIATVLVFYFAATLFNSAVKDNYETIQGWLQRASARLRFRRTSASKTTGDPRVGIKPRIVVYLEGLLVVAICALVYWFLEPYFKNTLKGVALFIALALGIAIATYGYEGTQVLLSARRFRVPAAIRIYWIAIVVAAICVAFSRAIHFHPGLIYGFVGAYAALSTTKLDNRKQAIMILLGTLVILVVSVSAFYLRELLYNSTWREGDFWRYLVEDILVAAIAIGLEGLVFSLAVPLTFMDGHKLKSWNLWVWLAVAGTVVYVFIWIIINADHRLAEAAKDMKVIMMCVLMGLSLVISGGTWLYFRVRKKRPSDQEAES